MNIEELSKTGEWEDFVQSIPSGTFYHSLKWKEVIEKSFPHQALYLVVKDVNGKVVGVSPGFVTESLHTRIYNSTPYSDYGGPVIEPSYVSKAPFAILNFLRNISLPDRLSYARFKVTEKSLENCLKSQTVHTESSMGVMEINLKTTPSQFIWNNLFSSNRRKKFKQMERRGFQVYEARTKSDFRVFYDLYLKNMTYLGAHPYPSRFMENMWDTLFPSFLRVRILENKKPVAAKLFFRYAQKSFSTYVGIDRNEPLVYPLGKYLTWTEIKKAEEEGIQQLSLGSTPSDPDNLYFIQKSSMGSEFNEQKIIWHPLSPSGRVLIQMRSAAVSAWKTVRGALPNFIESTLERKLSSL